MDQIELTADKSYTAKEIIAEVVKALNFVASQSKHNDLQYSSSDVYWLLSDLLRYVNARMQGEFALKRLKKGVWELAYTTEKAAQRKADERHKRELSRTADYIQEMTNRRPPWG